MSYISPEAELEEYRRLGEIRDTPPLPADYDPFSGSQEPFPLDSNSFKEAAEIADALVAGTEIGEEIIDFGRPIRSLRCPYCHYHTDDEDGSFFDAAQCICKE